MLPDQDGPATIRGYANMTEKTGDIVAPNWETLTIAKGGTLPHWRCGDAVYHVCFHLNDSIPKSVRNEWLAAREDIIRTARAMHRELSDSEERQLNRLYSEKIGKCLDEGYGECWLAKPEVSQIVARSLSNFDGNRYVLHVWCIMPNHTHVILETRPGRKLETIIHSWKSYSANQANRVLGRSGQFWQHEPYDHIIRDAQEYRRQVAYVWRNPEKAGVKALRWKRPDLQIDESSC